MRPWDKKPPADLEQLAADLGYGRKERTRLIAEYGEEKMRVKWTRAWLSVHVEKSRHLRHVPPAHVETIPWMTDRKGHGRPLEVIAFIDAALTQRKRRESMAPPPPDAEQIKQAGEESAYTSDVSRSVRNAGEPVPPRVQNLITMEGHARHAERVQKEKAEEQAKRDLQRLSKAIRETVLRMARQGINPTVTMARVEKELRAAEQDEREARKAA